MPAALAVLDPEVEWVAPASLPYGGVFHGPREIAEGYFGGFLEHVDDDFCLAADRFLSADGDVIASVRLRGHGRLSGAEFDVRAIQLWTVQDGCITRLEYHVDTAAILRALELPAAA